MNLVLIISIPFITALIGWFTNWVAIRMLFRPRNPVKVLGIQWQGLIPRRQADLATQTAEIIESEILQQHAIRGAIQQLDLEPHLKILVEKMIKTRLKEKLVSIPFIGGMINDSTIEMVNGIALQSLKEELPHVIDNLADDLESKIQVKQMVEDRMNALDLDGLEKIVKRVARKEFTKIEQLGAVLGFVVGAIQSGLLLLLG
ncbi:MAG: DUF445 family protein [Opitutales bacterium]|nr:DUF445 family protein [Opitutales bacterium]